MATAAAIIIAANSTMRTGSGTCLPSRLPPSAPSTPVEPTTAPVRHRTRLARAWVIVETRLVVPTITREAGMACCTLIPAT